MGVVYIVISISFDKHKVPIVIPFRSKEGAQECADYIKESHPEFTTFIMPSEIVYGFERSPEHKPHEENER